MKFFDGKLIALQELCSVNNKLLPGGIYGITLGEFKLFGAPAFIWCDIDTRVILGYSIIPPSQMIHVWYSNEYDYLCLQGP